MKSKLLGLCLFVAMCLCVSPLWGQSIEIKGSTTVLPVAQKVAEAYMKENPDVSISISGGGSGNGIKAMIDGTTDIAMASRFIKQKEVKRAIDNGNYPVPHAVALDSIIPVVHPDNPVDDLTLDQLKKIYQGKIKNWSAVGGKDKKIVVVSRDTSSGTYEVWEDIVLDGSRVYPGALLQASNGAVAQAVAKNTYAIGYVGIGYLNKDLKDLKVNGVQGTPETTASAEFPVFRTLFMFTDGWPEGGVAKFMNYIKNPEKGQKYAEEAGFVKLY